MNMIVPSTHLNKRFAKDLMLPIPVCEPEYIGYYIDLLDSVYNTKHKRSMFLDLWERLGCDDEAFFSYGARIQQEALELIKMSPSYESFIKDTSELFSGTKWVACGVPKGQVYQGKSDGKRFLSIDLVKANYQALRYYTRMILGKEPSDDDIVLGTSSFEEFISKFTDEEYYAEAKKFRQVIFGNMNPKRQQKIQRFIINKILASLLEEGWFSEKDLCDYTSDEIVFMLDDGSNTDSVIEYLNRKSSEWGIELHLDTYRLLWLKRAGEDVSEKASKIFAREFDDGRVDFKNVEASLIPQVIKRYKGINKLDKKDLLFYASNGMLAMYMKPIEWD